jgi:hypothetical protein
MCGPTVFHRTMRLVSNIVKEHSQLCSHTLTYAANVSYQVMAKAYLASLGIHLITDDEHQQLYLLI